MFDKDIVGGRTLSCAVLLYDRYSIFYGLFFLVLISFPVSFSLSRCSKQQLQRTISHCWIVFCLWPVTITIVKRGHLTDGVRGANKWRDRKQVLWGMFPAVRARVIVCRIFFSFSLSLLQLGFWLQLTLNEGKQWLPLMLLVCRGESLSCSQIMF